MTGQDIVAILVGMLVLAPLGMLVGAVDLRELVALLVDQGWRGAMVESAAVAVVGGAVAGPLGSLAAGALRGQHGLLPLLLLGLLVPPAAIAEPTAGLIAALGLGQTIVGWLWATLSPALAAAVLARLAADAGRLAPVPATVAASLAAGLTVWGAALVPAAAVGVAHPPFAALALEAMRQQTLGPGGIAALAVLLTVPVASAAVALGALIGRYRA